MLMHLYYIVQASMFWRKRVIEIASEYPDVELSHMYVDNAAMQLVRNPKQVSDLIKSNHAKILFSHEAD